MTEEKLAPKGRKASKRRTIGLVLAVLATFVAALWLFRQPIAEAIARSVCVGQKLSCRFSITRLDFGGVTLTGLDARAPDATNAALSARELVIDLAWDNPFAPRAAAIGGDELVVRLDLTGKRPLLGDLDTAIANFTKPSDKPAGPMPQLNFSKLTIIGDTLSGPVQALGTVKATGPDAFVIDLTAPRATLGVMGATMQLAGGQLKATIAGERISANATLDLARFEATDTRVSDVKIVAMLEQSAGVLKGSGTAALGAVTTKDTKFSGAKAQASMESAAIDPAGITLNSVLSNLRRLDLTASSSAGSFGTATWQTASLTAKIQPTAAGHSGGDILLGVDGVKLPDAAAGRLVFEGKLDIAEGVRASATGQARLQSGLVTTASRKILVDTVSAPLDAALPAFGEAAARAVDRAAQNFDVAAPWSATFANDVFEFALMPGSTLSSASGLSLAIQPATGQAKVASFTSQNSGSWSAAGSAQLSGGGAPPFTLEIAQATGGGDKVAITGALKLSPWRVGSDMLSADIAGLDFGLDGTAGKASGRLNVTIDGAFGGGIWKGARGTGEVSAVWDRAIFAADAPKGVVIQWDQASYGDTVLGKTAFHYTPAGRLAERVGEGVIGRGGLDAVIVPVNGGAWTAKAGLGRIGVNWRAANGFRANFDMEPVSVDMTLDQRQVPIRIQDIQGTLDLRSGWRVTGDFSGGSARAEEGTVADLSGKFNLGGRGDTLDGSLADIAMRVFDPKTEEDGKRFEEVKFTGGATLRESVAAFTGVIAMTKSGVEIANVSGSHSLEANAGSLTFEPTPLIFAPRAFQPYDMSPMLRGPANVTGRVDVSGAASWNKDGVTASAGLDLRKVGFTLASAGVFEGVSGKVQIADLINMKSAPGQQISLDKVTLGLPIEKGVIRFQLIGYEAIRVEGAEWPFANGFIRVRPTDFAFTEGTENRIVAQAVNWNLATIVEQFELPDLKLVGIVAGDFPVVFRTGSAKVDKATLEATKEGGVIQYTGSPGDAAAQANENSAMVFNALKDFRYEVLKVGLDGDLAGRMMMTLSVLGSNPAVLDGVPFQLNIGIDSDLVNLITTLTKTDYLER